MSQHTLDAPLAALSFLLGRWEALAPPGGPTGGFTFAAAALGRVIVRPNFADYPASPERLAFRREDLLVIYAGEAGGLRGDFYDSEGHVIRYAGQAGGAGEAAFISDPSPAGPGFRLAYRLQADGTLAGSFEIASPEQLGTFVPYLAWSARKIEAG